MLLKAFFVFDSKWSYEVKRVNWHNCLRNCLNVWFFWNNLTHLTRKAWYLKKKKRVSTATVQPENRFFSSGSSKIFINPSMLIEFLPGEWGIDKWVMLWDSRIFFRQWQWRSVAAEFVRSWGHASLTTLIPTLAGSRQEEATARI